MVVVALVVVLLCVVLVALVVVALVVVDVSVDDVTNRALAPVHCGTSTSESIRITLLRRTTKSPSAMVLQTSA